MKLGQVGGRSSLTQEPGSESGNGVAKGLLKSQCTPVSPFRRLLSRIVPVALPPVVASCLA